MIDIEDIGQAYTFRIFRISSIQCAKVDVFIMGFIYIYIYLALVCVWILYFVFYTCVCIRTSTFTPIHIRIV